MDAPSLLDQARDLSPGELYRLVADLGGKPFQGGQLVRWVYQKGLRDFAEATDLPTALREELDRHLELRAAEILEVLSSSDGTEKLLLGMQDGETIEMVLIPEGDRVTLCLSSQVGCPVGCRFCASGMLGVRRNLGQAEILEQFLIARERVGDRLTNLVLMGIGDPMLNLKRVLPALELISGETGFGFSPRRITVSTSGFPDRIRKFARNGRPYNLAISLHSASAEVRKRLLPTSPFGPRTLVEAGQEYFRATGREVTYEVVLLGGVNDRLSDAADILRLLRGVQCSVNLIPWNPVEGLEETFRTPREADVEAFRAHLQKAGLKATVRKKRGVDRNAACGQLRLRRS